MELIESIPLFRRKLLSWFAEYQRILPWRKGYQPYQVWISEIMGQQTQMDRVVIYFNNWMEQFPDIQSLASASEQEVFKAWEGLGYYSRARNIRKTASLLITEHGGVVPGNYAALLSLPGIGPYTAAAIMSIAYNEPEPLLDANVERVLCRIENIDQPVKQKTTREQLTELCKQLLPHDEPRNFNQAMMELGALVCKPKNPNCPACPVRQWCRALAADTVAERPVPGKKQQKIDIVMACTIISRNDQLYIQQRLPDDVWGGLWEFPGGRLKEGETPKDAAVREALEETEFQVIDLKNFSTVVHYYTKYRVTLHSFYCQLHNDCQPTPVLHAASRFQWVNRSELKHFAFPAGHRKLIEKMASFI